MANVDFKECSVSLGDEVEDKITKFAGVAVAITFWLNNCARVSVQPTKLDKEGKPKEPQVFDHMQLRITKPAKPVEPKRTGGPMNDRAATRRP